MVRDPWKAWAAGRVRLGWGRPAEARVLKDCDEDQNPSVRRGAWDALWGRALEDFRGRGRGMRPGGQDTEWKGGSDGRLSVPLRKIRVWRGMPSSGSFWFSMGVGWHSQWELRSLKPLSSPWTQKSWHDEVPKGHYLSLPVPHWKPRLALDITQASLVKGGNRGRNSGQH